MLIEDALGGGMDIADDLRLQAQTLPEVNATWLTTGDVAERYGITSETARAWMTDGLLMRDGSRLKLRGRRIGGRWLTVATWVEEFMARLGEAT